MSDWTYLSAGFICLILFIILDCVVDRADEGHHDDQEPTP